MDKIKLQRANDIALTIRELTDLQVVYKNNRVNCIDLQVDGSDYSSGTLHCNCGCNRAAQFAIGDFIGTLIAKYQAEFDSL